MKAVILFGVLAAISVEALSFTIHPLNFAQNTITAGVNLSNNGVKYGTGVLHKAIDKSVDIGNRVVTKVEEIGSDVVDKGTELAKSTLEYGGKVAGKLPVIGMVAAGVSHYLDSGVDKLNGLLQSGIGLLDIGASGTIEYVDHYGKKMTDGVAKGFDSASEGVIKINDAIFGFLG